MFIAMAMENATERIKTNIMVSYIMAFARSVSPRPISLVQTVCSPIAKLVPMMPTKKKNGLDRPTAAMASVPRYLAVMIPSISKALIWVNSMKTDVRKAARNIDLRSLLGYR